MAHSPLAPVRKHAAWIGFAALACAASPHALAAGPVQRVRAAAQADDAQALYRRGAQALADCGPTSTHCPTAIDALQRAAGQGLTAAEFLLATCLDQGRGVNRDRVAAFHAFQRAASSGHAGAAFALGVQYRDGTAGRSDLVESYKWFTIAFERWSPGSAAEGQEVYRRSRDEAARRLSPGQLAEGQVAVREWFQEFASNGSAP